MSLNWNRVATDQIYKEIVNSLPWASDEETEFLKVLMRFKNKIKPGSYTEKEIEETKNHED